MLLQTLWPISLRVYGDENKSNTFGVSSQGLVDLRPLSQRKRACTWAMGVTEVKEHNPTPLFAQAERLAVLVDEGEVGR